MDSKKLCTTLLSVCAALAAGSVSAQGVVRDARIEAARRQADTVILSRYADGPYTVSRLLIRGNNPETSCYDVHYAISRSDIERDIDDNAAQLNDIAGYVDPRTGDTLRHVECIKVKGYASPDGSGVMNRTLAAARARKFAAYLDRMYGTSKHCRVTVDSEALPWSSCRQAVYTSSMPDRTAVLAILDGNMTDAQKQARLKRMPEAWNWLAKNVLPQMRRVDVALDYDSDRLAMVRELTNPQPEIVFVKVTETVDCCPDTPCGNACCDPMPDEEFDGLMIEYFGCPDE